MVPKTQPTLYEKLINVPIRIPLGSADWPIAYVQDGGVHDVIKKTIISPYADHPVIRNAIEGKRTIAEMLVPVLQRAEEAVEKYKKTRFIQMFAPKKEIFKEKESRVAEELEGILDVKGSYSFGLICSEKISRYRDWFLGHDIPSTGRNDLAANLKPFYAMFRNGLPAGLTLLYLADTHQFFTYAKGLAGIIQHALAGSLTVMSGAVVTMFLTIPVAGLLGQDISAKIKKPTHKLLKQAKYLDKTIARLYNNAG